jgi:SAM-dependent methyltransferase
MVSRDRWQRAQQYERAYWAQQAESIAKGAQAQLGWYKWRSDKLVERLNGLGLATLTGGNAAVVEVGSGPVGVAGFFPASEQVLVDPLQEFYGSNPILSEIRNPKATYRQGGGEALPVESNHFDLAIIENCIDHVRDDAAVYRELARVLKPGGILYLTVNCRTKPGYLVHRTLSSLRLDPGHPHTYTPSKLKRLLPGYGFEILDMEVGSYSKAREEDRRSPSKKARVKALLGISEYLSSVVARIKKVGA